MAIPRLLLDGAPPPVRQQPSAAAALRLANATPPGAPTGIPLHPVAIPAPAPDVTTPTPTPAPVQVSSPTPPPPPALSPLAALALANQPPPAPAHVAPPDSIAGNAGAGGQFAAPPPPPAPPTLPPAAEPPVPPPVMPLPAGATPTPGVAHIPAEDATGPIAPAVQTPPALSTGQVMALLRGDASAVSPVIPNSSGPPDERTAPTPAPPPPPPPHLPPPDQVAGNTGNGGQFAVPPGTPPPDLTGALGVPTGGPIVVPGFSTDANGAIIPPTGAPADAAAGDGTGFTTIGAPGNGNPGGGSLLDNYAALINGDPAYIKQQGFDASLLDKGAGAEAALVRQLLLGYGSQTMAKQVLEQLAKSDPRLAAAIGNVDDFVNQRDANGNPIISDDPNRSISTLAQLARAFSNENRNNDESYNDRNLFWSGAHAKAAGDLAYGQQVKLGSAYQTLQGALTSAASAYSALQDSATQKNIDAYTAAYQRLIDEALKYGNSLGTGSTVDGTAQPITDAFTRTTSGQTEFTPEQLKTIAALPVNKTKTPLAPTPAPVQKKKTKVPAGGGGRLVNA